MIQKIFFCLAIIVALPHLVSAQRITFSEPDRDDVRSVDFDIVGKINDKYLVYKRSRGTHNISVYDDEMKQVDRVKMDFLPEKIINSDIIAYKNFFYFIYQYQKRNIVYCNAAKINSDGKIEGEPVTLDTTAISFFASNKIYNVLYSEDKQRIGVYKINSKDETKYLFTFSVFDASLARLSKNATIIPMQPNYDFLTEFSLDNDGGIAFVKASGNAAKSDNGTIQRLTLMVAPSSFDSIHTHFLDVPKIYFNDIRVKVDNINKHIIIASFYSKQKRGNIDGMFSTIWSHNANTVTSTKLFEFSDELKSNAKREGSARSAFNDYFLQSIVARKDGGFIIISESAYSTSRGVYNDRWSNLYGNPYWYNSNSYLYGGYSYYPWGGGPYGYGFPNQLTRYYADNIAVLSFDSTASPEWASIIEKSQYDDNSDNFIGYGTFITPDQINFLYNQFVRRTLLLQLQSINPQGKVTQAPTLKDLDKGFQFMPRFLKQISSRAVLVPCQYRNYLCFAKIEF